MTKEGLLHFFDFNLDKVWRRIQGPAAPGFEFSSSGADYVSVPRRNAHVCRDDAASTGTHGQPRIGDAEPLARDQA